MLREAAAAPENGSPVEEGSGGGFRLRVRLLAVAMERLVLGRAVSLERVWNYYFLTKNSILLISFIKIG